MKKLVCLGLAIAPLAALAQHRIYLDDEEVVFKDVKPVMVNGRMMVPLRGIFERMGISIEWQPEKELVIARKAADLIELEVNSRTARINGQDVVMEVAPYHLRGRTMVPLRLISQATGADVSFRDGAVRITSKKERKLY